LSIFGTGCGGEAVGSRLGRGTSPLSLPFMSSFAALRDIPAITRPYQTSIRVTEILCLVIKIITDEYVTRRPLVG
jgi:hypothetical protein